jgi:hypothetical protein
MKDKSPPFSACLDNPAYHQINNSQSFLTEQAFFSASDAAAIIALFAFLAEAGHFATQHIHEIHFPESTFFVFSRSIACTGHCCAHKPQFMQSFVAFGTKPAPPAFL